MLFLTTTNYVLIIHTTYTKHTIVMQIKYRFCIDLKGLASFSIRKDRKGIGSKLANFFTVKLSVFVYCLTVGSPNLTCKNIKSVRRI